MEYRNVFWQIIEERRHIVVNAICGWEWEGMCGELAWNANADHIVKEVKVE